MASEVKKKKSLLSRILKWTGISFLLILIFIIAAPFLFKDKLVQLVKDQANANLNAKVDFGEFDLTIFSSFPDFRFKIQNVSVVGVNEFAGDTLAAIKNLELDLNLMSVIKGEEYNIKKILLERPIIHGQVLADGKANWDIAKPSTDTAAAAPSEPLKFKLKLKKFKIADAWITYDDSKDNMKASIDDFDFDLAGDFSQDNFLLEIVSEIKKLSFSTGGVGYANNMHVGLKINMDMDMPNSKYTFKENEINLNELGLGIDGFVAMPGDDINMDIKFLAKQTEFKNILSLIPAVYAKEFASVQTKGKLALNGNAKGTYNDKTLPAFGVHLEIADAMFKYPSLPKSVNNINVKVDVENATGAPDATVIDVHKFHVEMAGNPVDMSMHVKTPVSDPNLNGWIKGVINLASVKEFVPMEAGDDMNGTVKMNVNLAGRLSSIEQEKYEDFKAEGTIGIEKVNYKTASLPYDVMINSMTLNFSPQYVDLVGFDCVMGKSDIQAGGKIENFLQYIFKDSLIKGNFNLNSNVMDLNQLMSSNTTEPAPAAAAPADTAPMSIIEVPNNIDFVLNANLKKVLYDTYDISNMAGNIVVRGAKVDMTNLKMNLMDGAMVMNGSYNTVNPKKPGINFNLEISDFDIQKTFNAFNSVQKLAPIGQYTKGKFSASLKDLVATLTPAMEPDLNTLSGGGALRTKSVKVEGYEAFDKLADALKLEQFKKIEFQNLDISFEFRDGRVHLKPFNTKIADIPTEIVGSTGFDQTIDYRWVMDVPTKMFGNQAQNMVGGLLGQANSALGTNATLPEKVKVAVSFGGTATKPTIKTGMNGQKGSVKDQVNNLIEEKKEEVVAAVKDLAAEEAAKILADAQKQVDQLKSDAQKQSETLKAEGYKQADDLQNKGGNPLEKIANKKLAENMRKQTDKQVASLLDEANKKADGIMTDANARAEKAKQKK